MVYKLQRRVLIRLSQLLDLKE